MKSKLYTLLLIFIFVLSGTYTIFAATSAPISVPIPVPIETTEIDREIPLYTVYDFFGMQVAWGFSLSADGENLLFLAPYNGILNIFRRNISTGYEEQLTFERSRPITNYFLVGNEVLYIQDNQGDEIFQIFRVNNDGTTTNLTPFPNVRAFPISGEIYNNEEIFIAMNMENPQHLNIYRLNVFTGEYTRVLDQFVDGLLMDNDGVIRVITRVYGVNVDVFHRYTNEDDFELVVQWHTDESAQMVAFGENSNYAYAISNIGRNTSALVRINPSTGEELEVLFSRFDVDVAGVSFTRAGTLGQVAYITDRIRWHFFCSEAEAFANEVSALFDANYIISISSVSEDFRRAIVTISSDISRGGIYLVDVTTKTTEQLVCRNRNINPTHMAPMRHISYVARDGRTIQGYLTLPVGVEATNLPLVVIPHGGPWVRDTWGWNNEVQFLANRGYAVFQPNFRGSAGFGREFLQAGYGQWGLAMQDDITDGVLWLIEQNIIDYTRIAIYGGSYGGYAALAGAAFTPDLYAAVISMVGVSNIFTLLDSIPVWWESERELLYLRVGHPVYDYDRLRATSPVFFADNITAPLFIAHGANDPRVSLHESLQIYDALTARGVDVELFIAWDEGHGFTDWFNIHTFYTVLEAFLAEHIGGRTTITLDELERPLYNDRRLEVFRIFNDPDFESPAIPSLPTVPSLPEPSPLEEWIPWLMPDSGVEVLEYFTDAMIIYDEHWGILVVGTSGIPVNINGLQGIVKKRTMELDESYIGQHSVIFDRFSEELDNLNIAVYIGERRLIAYMNVLEGDGFNFEILPEDVGGVLTIVMSTNINPPDVYEITDYIAYIDSSEIQNPLLARISLIFGGAEWLREIPEPYEPDEEEFFTDIELEFWINRINTSFSVNWTIAPETSKILDDMFADGVDHKGIGIVMIQDLLEVLDDFNGPIAFNDLWGQFMWQWEGWQDNNRLIFLGGNFNVNWAISNSLLQEHYQWLRFSYGMTGVNWNEFPEIQNYLLRLIDSGVDHKTFGLILVKDFLTFLDDFPSDIAFYELWASIVAHNWEINEL